MKKNKNVLFSDIKCTPNFKNKNDSIMKKLLFIVLMLCNVLFANSATNEKQTSQNLLKKITKDNYSLREIPLDQYTSLKRTKENIDKYGKKHIKYQIDHKDVPVENHWIIAHHNENDFSVRGRIVSDLDDINTIPTLTEAKAKQIAIIAAEITNPIWKIAEYEKLKQTIENDPKATNEPIGELVIYDGNYSYVAAQYRLAYKFDIL